MTTATLDAATLHSVGEYLYDLIETNQAELGLAGVYYGDQERLPSTPSVCIETAKTTRELVAIPRRVDTMFEVYVIIYHNPVADTTSVRRDVEELTDAVEALIHTKPSLGDLVIHAFVTTVEHGYVTKNERVVRASRLLVSCQSKQNLPGF